MNRVPVRHLQALVAEIVDPRADLENLDFLHANDVVEKIANPALFTADSNILGSPLDSIPSLTPCFFSVSRPGFTSGKAARLR